jgi:ADP-heptose:LPS heptosyltransferase
MAQSLVTHAFITLMDRSPQLNEINYLKAPVFNNKLLDFTLPKNYVVVTTGYTSSTREWKAKYINDFVRNVKKGLELDVVFLGKEVNSLYRNQVNLTGFSTEVDTTHGIDLRDKTDLFQALEIMRGARAVVGLDNGLTHLAAMTDVPIVMGFTTVDPKHRLPVRHNQLGWNVATVTPYLELPCRLCQSRMNFVKWDFRKCFYDDYACLEHITGVRMYEALYKVLNKELK